MDYPEPSQGDESYYHEEEWQGLGPGDPEQSAHQHSLRECLQLHDVDKEIESMDHTGVTILVHCRKCGTRNVHYEHWNQ